MYARLLLGMILSKNFTDPFDTNPSDGPLPPFPSHLKIKLKSISGPHESNFWRNIYHRVPSSSHEGIHGTPQMVNLNTEPDWRFDAGRNEIESLRQLIQEQSRRIEILEDQITSERMNHESEIIRFMEHHRGEIDALKRRSGQYDHHQHRVTSETSLSPGWSRKSHGHSRSSNSSPLRGFGSGPTRSFETERVVPSRLSHSSPDSLDGSKILSFSSTKKGDRSFSKYSTSLFASPRDDPLLAVEEEQKEESTSGRKSPFKTQNADIFPGMSHLEDTSRPDRETSDMKVLFEKSIPDEDSDFLRYLENFQSELRSFH
jgi:hypothetical protein